MMLDASLVRELVEAEDLLPVIWKAMVRIWESEGSLEHEKLAPEMLKAFYDEREEQLFRLERFLSDIISDLYELLLQRAIKQEGDYVLRWLQGNNAVIIADSLSVREATLLRYWFPQLDFAEDQPFAVAPFPTLTESLAQKLLRVNAPSGGKDTERFSYRYIAGPGTSGHLFPEDCPLLIWLRLPDAELEQVTEAQTTKMADVLRVTIETLGELLQRLGERKVVITSDHGYFYAASSRHFKEVSFKGLEGLPRERRAYRSAEAASLTSSGQEVTMRHGEWVVFKGRYWLSGGGQNARHTAHGGLSLAEVLVPVLEAKGK
jgi:hypothetical protein